MEDPKERSESKLTAIAAGLNVSWAAWHPSLPVLYAVSEVVDYANASGSVAAFSFATGRAKLLGRVSTNGAGPVYCTVDPSGSRLMVANYRGGNLVVLDIETDGSLRGVNETHMQGLGTHTVVESSKYENGVLKQIILSTVLSKNQIREYTPSTSRHKPFLHPRGLVQLPPGTGPRHIAFHPSLPLIFVSDEGNRTSTAKLTVLLSKNGKLDVLGSVAALAPEANSTDMYPAEVHFNYYVCDCH